MRKLLATAVFAWVGLASFAAEAACPADMGCAGRSLAADPHMVLVGSGNTGPGGKPEYIESKLPEGCLSALSYDSTTKVFGCVTGGIVADGNAQTLCADGELLFGDAGAPRCVAVPTCNIPGNEVLTYNGTAFSCVVVSGGGVTVHANLTGLGADDHLQYVRTDGTRAITGNQTFEAGATFNCDRVTENCHPQFIQDDTTTTPVTAGVCTLGPRTNGWLYLDCNGALQAYRLLDERDVVVGATDHGALTGLTPDDDHPQYAKTDGSRDITGTQTYLAGATYVCDPATQECWPEYTQDDTITAPVTAGVCKFGFETDKKAYLYCNAGTKTQILDTADVGTAPGTVAAGDHGHGARAWHDVRDFGAGTGETGATNTASIQAAIDAAATDKGVVYCTGGTYVVDALDGGIGADNHKYSLLIQDVSDIAFVGDCTIQSSFAGTAVGPVAGAANGHAMIFRLHGTVDNITFEGITLQGLNSNSPSPVPPTNWIRGVWNTSGNTISRIHVRNVTFEHLISGMSFNANLGGSFTDSSVENSVFINMAAEYDNGGSGYGVDDEGTNNRIVHNRFDKSGRHDIYIANAKNAFVADNHSTNHRQDQRAAGSPLNRSAINITRSVNTTVVGNTIEDFWDGAFFIGAETSTSEPSDGTTFVSNHIIQPKNGAAWFQVGETKDTTVGERTSNVLISKNTFKGSETGVESGETFAMVGRLNNGFNIQLTNNVVFLSDLTLASSYDVIQLGTVAPTTVGYTICNTTTDCNSGGWLAAGNSLEVLDSTSLCVGGGDDGLLCDPLVGGTCVSLGGTCTAAPVNFFKVNELAAIPTTDFSIKVSNNQYTSDGSPGFIRHLIIGGPGGDQDFNDLLVEENTERNWGQCQFTDGDATPNVQGVKVCRTNNTGGATTITNLDEGIPGQDVLIVVQDANTTFDFSVSSLTGHGGVDFAAASGDWVYCTYWRKGPQWACSTSDGGAAGAPTTADYLTGTAQAGLSAEIVVGATPGGELGGTWAAPTVDATHSGSAHHTKYTDGEAVTAMGVKGDANPLNHDKAVNAVSSVFGRTAAVVAAPGDYTAAQVTNVPAGTIAAIEVQAAINELDADNTASHHTKYLDSEAVAAMGVLGDANPLNHDRAVDTTCASPTNCDLGASSTVESSLICRADGTNCPAGGAAFWRLGDTDYGQFSVVELGTDLSLQPVDACVGGTNPRDDCTLPGGVECLGGGVCTANAKLRMASDVVNYKQGRPVLASDAPDSCTTRFFTALNIGTAPVYCTPSGQCSSTVNEGMVPAPNGARVSDLTVRFTNGTTGATGAAVTTAPASTCSAGSFNCSGSADSGTVVCTSTGANSMCTTPGVSHTVTAGDYFAIKLDGNLAAQDAAVSVVVCLPDAFFTP